MKRTLTALLCTLTALSAVAQGQQWSKEKAWEWYGQNPWFCGVNYIPAYAINYTAMFDKTSYNPEAMDTELQLMEDMGMNCARFVMQYAVYEENPSRFLKVLDKFLAICDSHNIKAMPIFFDDCSFSPMLNPKTGKQPEPLEGWYAWAWSPSPGHEMVCDFRTHGKLEKYVKDVLTRFKDDDRIMLWDLYNEPAVSFTASDTCLCRKVFRWAREVDPSQPLSICMWNGDSKLDEYLAQNCDIITFHKYADKKTTRDYISKIKEYGRPLICTEWMNRPCKSTIKDVLPVFKELNVGCMSWGLVNGKDQTNLPWGHRPEMLPYTGPWQHDLFKGDHTPYDESEIDLIKKTIADKPAEHPGPVNPNATPEAKELLARLYKFVDDGIIVSGLHRQSESDMKNIGRATGKEPVVVGGEFAWDGARTTENCIAAYETGHIITLMWHAPRPFDKGPVSFGGHTCGKMTEEQWNELMTEGSDMYNMWLAQIDSIAVNFLKPFKDRNIPVLWRPYHENNGEWFWWGWKEGEKGFGELYRRMWDRYVNYHHLDNILWVWNANAPRDKPGDTAKEYSKFYPGNDYVDVLATDVYARDWKQSHHDQLVELGGGKLIALGEIGNLPTPEDLEHMNKYAWFMIWNGFTSEKHNPAEDMVKIFNRPNTFTFEAAPENCAKE